LGQNEVVKALLAFAVEDVLLEIGKPMHDVVLARLKKEYDCSVFDCLENPEYLSRILGDIFGNNSQEILSRMKAKLGDLVEDRSLKEFFEYVEIKQV
jgi:hypothetical protein